MSQVIVSVQVQDTVTWEKGFRGRVELLRRQGIVEPVRYSVQDGRAVVCFEPIDVDAFLAELTSPETAKVMEADGVDRTSVDIVVLDRVLEV